PATDPTGIQSGVGTSFFSAKIRVYERKQYSFKVAVSPTLQLLTKGIAESLGTTTGRVQVGLPVSAEVSSGALRFYGGGGFFSPGLWFGGGAVGVQVNKRTNLSVGLSRAWRTSETDAIDLSQRDRKELSGGVAYALRPLVSVFGSIGQTF